MNSTLTSFNCVAKADAKILILGTMPSIKSLQQHEYYAHPRNCFWDIMGEIIGFSRNLDYHSRLKKLSPAKIALWDVIASCKRKGSLDSNIENESITPNNFTELFSHCPDIKMIFFNGQPAAKLYKKHALPTITEPFNAIPSLTLPSTSPANALWSYEKKLSAWQTINQIET